MRALRWRRDHLRTEVIAGKPAAIERQHGLGKRTARERLELLLDEGSFIEIEMHRRHEAHGLKLGPGRPATDGVVAYPERYTADGCSSTRRTSRCSAARSAVRTLRRSTR